MVAAALAVGGLGMTGATAAGATPAWQAQSVPAVRGTPDLLSVSCTSTKFCMAVGTGAPRAGASRLSGGQSGLFAERWNGRSWSKPTYVPIGGATDAVLNSVECRSVSDCYAVGTVTKDWGVKHDILAEHWNGTAWTVVNLPAPADDDYGDLSSIACSSASSCLAVGQVEIVIDHGVEYAGGIFERWNGSDWTYSYHGPQPKERGVDFAGVDCPSTQSCDAVGSLYAGPLIQTWNGKTWARAATPTGIRSAILGSVSCSSVGACTAVGETTTERSESPLVWRIVSLDVV